VKQIVVINGYPKSGKDTFIDACGNHTNILRYSIIDWVKSIARACGWEGKKTPQDRKFLCELKDLMEGYNDMPFQAVCNVTEEFYDKNDGVIFITMREPKDIERFKTLYPNAVTLFINRPLARFVNKVVADDVRNRADDNVENYNYDYYIDNKGTVEALEESAVTFLNDLEEIYHEETAEKHCES
jgi:adenylate kinase family enzyme